MAIEAREFTEKDELIAKLSTIRDGLDVIDAENQKIANAEEELRRLQTLTEEQRESYLINVQKLEKRKGNLEAILNSYKKKAGDLSIKKRDIENSKPREYASVARGFVIATIIIAILFAIFTVAVYEEPNGSMLSAAVLCVGILLTILFIVITVVERNRRGNRIRFEALKKIKLEIEKNEDIEDGIDQKNAEIEAVSLELEELLANEPTCEELQALIKKVEEEIKPESLAKISEAEKLIMAAADGILEKEDWRNAGTLVYYLKTGRADSLKEALLMMLDQNRNEDLINSIMNAAYDVTYAVNRMATSMRSFGEEINDAYRKTAKKFDRSYSDMQYAMESISNRVNTQLSNLSSTIESQGRAIAEAERKNADLLAHANQNSDELMYKIRYNS